MNYKDFEHNLGKSFKTQIQDHEVSLKLTQIDMLEPILPKDYSGPKPDHYIEEPFRLTFCGPSDLLLEPQMYELTGEDGATYLLFLSGFLQNKDGIHYEALFK